MDKGNHACPVCGQIDQVQKVSAIVADQTQHVSGAGYDGSYSGTQVSSLAQKLKAPNKPRSGCEGDIIFMALGGITFLFFGLFSAGNLMSHLRSTVDVLMFLVSIGAIVLGLVIMVRGRRTHNQRVAQVEMQEVPKWRHARERWEALYYCYRDDVVYVPGEASVPVSQMTEYLYK
jgi:hypothetical protein